MKKLPKITVPVSLYEDSRGNRISGCAAESTGSKVVFASHGCSLSIEEGVKLPKCEFLFDAPGGCIHIGKNSVYKGRIRVGLESTVRIGSRLTVTRNCHITAAEKTTVTIGNDCMFATENEIRADDAHAIYDADTGLRINQSRSISIGDRVWLAFQAAVMSGSSIGSGSVIAYRSLVRSSIPENCVAAGIPARVVRENIVWKRAHVSKSYPHFFPSLDFSE